MQATLASKLAQARACVRSELLTGAEFASIARRLRARAPPLTNEAIHRRNAFRAASAPQSAWLAGGKAYTVVESGEIVRYCAATSERSIVVSKAALTPAHGASPLAINGYQWSDDGSKVLIFTNSMKVWRRNSRGDYYVLTLATSTLRRVGRQGAAAESRALYYAKFSPGAGERVAYVFENNVWAHDLVGDAVLQLTTDGLPGHGGMAPVINGNFDWVYEEELALSDGWRWSPDGTKIAYWQLRTDGVESFPLVDWTSRAPYASVANYPYPKVGSANPVARIAWVRVPARGDVEVAPPTFLALEPADGGEHYIARMEWAASSDEVVVQRLPRRQHEIDLLLCRCVEGAGPSSASPRRILCDHDETWIDVRNDMKWLDGGSSFTWVSERSGYRHIYVVSRDGKVRDITAALGDADVLSVNAIDDASGWVYFTSTLPSEPLERYLYRARIAAGEPGADGDTSCVERLTPRGAAFAGSHAYRIAPSGAAFAVHTHSAFGTPPHTEIVSLPGHSAVRTLEDNAVLQRRLDDVDRSAHEFITVDTGSTEVPGVSPVLDGYALFPPGFDKARAAGRSAPLLVHVYGEPASCTVRDAWGGNVYMWHLLMAQRGYVVVSFDSRGTPAPKGRAWRKSVYRKIGVTSNNDQAAAVRALLNRWRFLDPNRVAVWGWSGGGSSTLQAMFRFPDVYSAGAAIAFIADQRLYDTIYQERYMGVPAPLVVPREAAAAAGSASRGGATLPAADYESWQHYVAASPVSHVAGLKGDLLIAYGTGDDNCHFQNCAVLIDALVAHDKHFETCIYPNRTHGIAKGENTRNHLFSALTRFFARTVPSMQSA